jgi:hypothetical protein
VDWVLLLNCCFYNKSLCYWSTFAGRPSKIQSCLRASSGVILCSGFHEKHWERKSINSLSLHRSYYHRVLVPGCLFFPFEFGTIIGSDPVKNNFLLLAYYKTSPEGTPNTSIINPIWSYSDSPGNIGHPNILNLTLTSIEFT